MPHHSGIICPTTFGLFVRNKRNKIIILLPQFLNFFSKPISIAGILSIKKHNCFIRSLLFHFLYVGNKIQIVQKINEFFSIQFHMHIKMCQISILKCKASTSSNHHSNPDTQHGTIQNTQHISSIPSRLLKH